MYLLRLVQLLPIEVDEPDCQVSEGIELLARVGGKGKVVSVSDNQLA